jgi:hypothetical protein
MGLDCGQTLPVLDLLNYPGDRFAQRFAEHGTAGLADGRQASMSPLLRTVMLQLTHQSTVRQEYEIHVPCLALATPELTRAHTQMLLPVPMEGLSSCPAFAVGLQNAMHFPIGPVGDQDLGRFGIALPSPQHHDPYRMLDAWNTDTLGEVPLDLAIHGRFAPAERPQCGLGPVARLPILAIDCDGAIELQIPNVVAVLAGDVIEDLGVGEVTVEGEITRNSLINHPIDQFFAEDGVVLKRRIFRDTDVLLPKAAELQGVVFE